MTPEDVNIDLAMVEFSVKSSVHVDGHNSTPPTSPAAETFKNGDDDTDEDLLPDEEYLSLNVPIRREKYKRDKFVTNKIVYASPSYRMKISVKNIMSPSRKRQRTCIYPSNVIKNLLVDDGDYDIDPSTDKTYSFEKMIDEDDPDYNPSRHDDGDENESEDDEEDEGDTMIEDESGKDDDCSEEVDEDVEEGDLETGDGDTDVEIDDAPTIPTLEPATEIVQEIVITEVVAVSLVSYTTDI